MRSFFIASILAFVCICGFNYLIGICGLVIHNHLISMAVSAVAGSGSVVLAGRI